MTIPIYLEQVIPAFRGNKLIEALPPLMSEQTAFESMQSLPEYSAEQRKWPSAERIVAVSQLSDVFIPLERGVTLAQTIDSMIRHGYKGRCPATYGAVHEKLFQMQERKQGFQNLSCGSTAATSTALIGVSGGGKTTSVRRALSYFPQVIHHPEMNITQITHLSMDMSTVGDSVKGLATGIFHQIDRLVPSANSYEHYGKNSRASVDTMIRNAARVMHDFRVGILVIEEIQNLLNKSKDTERAMTEVVTMTNEIGLPLLFTGTNKATQLFETDFRLTRRVVGGGLEHWERLKAPSTGTSNDWDFLIERLWKFQWTTELAALTLDFSKLLYDRSQGIIDIALKLFMAAQVVAIRNNYPSITEELLEHAYQTQLKTIHPMLEALRDNDMYALGRFPDIAPVKIRSKRHGDSALLSVNKAVKAAVETQKIASTHQISLPKASKLKNAKLVLPKRTTLPGRTPFSPVGVPRDSLGDGLRV